MNAVALKVAAMASPESEECPERHKSKKKAKRKHKHKRKGENKTSKDKSKRSKRKHQKPKETFHWQPPLEFGEEDDDDESKKERTSPRRAKDRPERSPHVDNKFLN